MKYKKEEKREIVLKLKAAAVAVAELWDTVHEVEERTGKEINFSIGPLLADDLAPSCQRPPTMSDLDDKQVWESFKYATKEGK